MSPSKGHHLVSSPNISLQMRSSQCHWPSCQRKKLPFDKASSSSPCCPCCNFFENWTKFQVSDILAMVAMKRPCRREDFSFGKKVNGIEMKAFEVKCLEMKQVDDGWMETWTIGDWKNFGAFEWVMTSFSTQKKHLLLTTVAAAIYFAFQMKKRFDKMFRRRGFFTHVLPKRVSISRVYIVSHVVSFFVAVSNIQLCISLYTDNLTCKKACIIAIFYECNVQKYTTHLSSTKWQLCEVLVNWSQFLSSNWMAVAHRVGACQGFFCFFSFWNHHIW